MVLETYCVPEVVFRHLRRLCRALTFVRFAFPATAADRVLHSAKHQSTPTHYTNSSEEIRYPYFSLCVPSAAQYMRDYNVPQHSLFLVSVGELAISVFRDTIAYHLQGLPEDMGLLEFVVDDLLKGLHFRHHACRGHGLENCFRRSGLRDRALRCKRPHTIPRSGLICKKR